MMRSLKTRMILTYLAVALVTVLVVSLLIRFTSGQSLMNLVVDEQTSALQQRAVEYYTATGSWDGFFAAMQTDRLPPDAQPGPERPPDGRGFRGLAGMVDLQNRAIVPTFGYDIGQSVPESEIRQREAVVVNGQTVAYILPDTKFQFRLSAEEQVFLRRTTLAIWLAALAGVLVALLTGFFFAARLLQPIRLLTQASESMARGDLNQQVPVTSNDELGRLTRTFNQMSADLDRADQQRKRMTADITHDLSTPIQIIAGYMEMLEDSEVTLTPQRIEIIKTELEHLRRLVGDMSTLTQVESGALDYQPETVRPAALLERVFNAYQPIAARQGVTLALDTARDAAPVRVDEGRMEQVLKNLVENALRHTPSAGTVRLGAAGAGPVEVWVQDSGEGIDPEDLPYVFDRFYRADKARSGNSGKMGLGLAICKALVQAQGGSITAESAGKGQGTRVVIRLDAAG